jgi:hypothetical protein
LPLGGGMQNWATTGFDDTSRWWKIKPARENLPLTSDISNHMYDIKQLVALEKELRSAVRSSFVDFFSGHDYTKDSKAVVSRAIKSLSDAEEVHYGTGLYVIMSDYQIEENRCSLVIDGLKAIYRGHCSTVKRRLKSHLFNDHYRSNLPERGVRYDVCMKLDEKNGINICDLPYSNYRWSVVVHKMKDSSKLMREQAELAFDDVFGRPLGSREAG